MNKTYTNMDLPGNKYLASQIEGYLKNRIVVILYHKNGLPNVGTGTFISRDQKTYLITCEHVYSEGILDPKSIYKSNKWKTPKLLRDTKIVSISTELDIAILELPYSFEFTIPWSSFSPVPKYPKNIGMLLIGYPAELGKRISTNNYNVSPWKYWTSHAMGKKTERHTFALEYDADLNNTDVVNYHKLPDVPGMSGSLVVVPRRMKNNELWTPGDIDVIGVEKSWNKRSAMFATRGNWIKKFWK